MTYAFIALALLLAGCSSPSTPLARHDPADPASRVRPVDYVSVIGSYASRRPAEPKPWTEQNRNVAPRQE